MRKLIKYLKYRKNTIILIVSIQLIFLINTYLFKIPYEFYMYSSLLILILLMIVSIYDYKKYQRKKTLLEFKLNNIEDINLNFDDYNNDLEFSYQQLIIKLNQYLSIKINEYNNKQKDWEDYLSLWLHQIKLPIAAISLLLEERDINKNVLKSELYKIQQYSEMTMAYLRIESNDYLFETFDVNRVIKNSIKHYSREFINKQNKINYQEMPLKFTTDKKWLEFIIDQIISNSLKYTKQGEITILLEENTITIKDTGIGIKASDLPRIFEKGYSGFNGHNNQKSSGIGLYLCKKIAKEIGIEIEITSNYGKGTSVYLKNKKE